MKSQAWKFISRPVLYKILSLSLLQQVLIAVSTLALARAGLYLKSPEKLMFWCIISLVLHIAAPVLQILIKRFEFELSFEAYRKFIDKFLLQKAGTPAMWRRKDLKDNFTSSIGVDAEGYLAAILFVGLDLFTYIISLILGVLVLGLFIDMKFIPAFVVAGVLSYLCYSKLSPWVREKYEQEQKARTQFNGYLLSCWDNVFFKNKSIINIYKDNLSERYAQAKKDTVAAAKTSEMLVFCLGIVSSLPVVLLICWIGYENLTSEKMPILLALLATVSRQLNMLTTFRNIFMNMTSFLGFESKFSVIINSLDLPVTDYVQQIQFSNLRIGSIQRADLKEVEAYFAEVVPGRYEIRGGNGCGKSTLLLHLNDSLASSFYLPSHPDLAIGANASTMSSGQKLLQHIEFLALGTDRYLLLDEWDANLDINNMLMIEKRLNELAQTKIIVEVRHREPA